MKGLKRRFRGGRWLVPLTMVTLMLPPVYSASCVPYVRKGAQAAGAMTQTGKASWYGPGFHGKKTANGEKYDMHARTAAHKTLPFGTVVKVTYPKTKKSVIVRINDRGPFVKGRIIDLSYDAARAIGLLKSGVGDVVIEVMELGQGK